MLRMPSLNSLEQILLGVVWFNIGVAAGAIISAFPHPLTRHQTTISSVFLLGGTILCVCFSIHRANKEWKHRTTPPLGNCGLE